MEYTKLGNSDLNISRICMGCMGFGKEGFAYLEEPYIPHDLVGVMAQNTLAAAKEKHI